MDNDKTTWRKELNEIFARNGDGWDYVVGMVVIGDAVDERGFDIEFERTYEPCVDVDFTLWTNAYVYQSRVEPRDDYRWVQVIIRNPPTIKDTE